MKKENEPPEDDDVCGCTNHFNGDCKYPGECCEKANAEEREEEKEERSEHHSSNNEHHEHGDKVKAQ